MTKQLKHIKCVMEREKQGCWCRRTDMFDQPSESIPPNTHTHCHLAAWTASTWLLQGTELLYLTPRLPPTHTHKHTLHPVNNPVQSQFSCVLVSNHSPTVLTVVAEVEVENTFC
ncbi:hypothetical protein CHARACLAT_009964 [Characodon lateralis]|uniref:Uncharacterized protein n=1 Tax=Characodon lateralis TaxID=208331 RepID=A0ABU7D8G1_9TELE|nr:hypothetical protein [Characodon lateralis]